jgi:putative ABC transport system permease protein
MDLVLLFGMSALLLASLGIYGVVSYSVRHRTSEIGIRMALGALRSNICGMVLRQGLTPVIAGLSAGIIASFMAGRLIKSLLFGVSAADAMAIAGVVLLLMLVAACAILVPALRAARVDPAAALRYE